MSKLLPAAKLIFSAHKAWAGGGLAFLAPLLVPLGAPPDDTMAITVLLSALITPWTHANIDPVLLEQSMKALWVAMGFGGGAGGAVYAVPNTLKKVLPVVEQALSIVTEAQAAAENPDKPAAPVSTAIPPIVTLAFVALAAVLFSGVPGDAMAMAWSASASSTLATASIVIYSLIAVALMTMILWRALPVLRLIGLVERSRRVAPTLLLAGLVLNGCASDQVATNALQDFSEEAAQADQDRGLTQKLADQLLGEAKGEDHRGLRLCMLFAGVSELMADRVTKADPDYAHEALGQISVLESVQETLDATAANVWFETDVKLATLTLADILVEVGKDRVPRLLSNLTGGVNVLGVVDRARVAARQADIAGAVIRDVKKLMFLVANNQVTPDAAREACSARMEQNRKKVAAVAGVD